MKLFIYGTLKKDFLGHNFLVPYIENGQVKPLGYFRIYGFELRVGIAPFLVRSSNSENIVEGELYEFSDSSIIEYIDIGESWYYNREIVCDEIYAYIAKQGKYLDESIPAGSIYTKKMDNEIKSRLIN